MDFEIRISDFPIKHEIPIRILPYGNLSTKWISLKNCNLGFHGFQCYFSDPFGNPENDLQSCSDGHRFITFQFWVRNLLRSFSKPRRKATFIQQTNILTSRKIALHVRYSMAHFFDVFQKQQVTLIQDVFDWET